MEAEIIEADRLARLHSEAFEGLQKYGYNGPEELNAEATIALVYEIRALRLTLELERINK
jgi:hypothetical protein